MDESDDLSRAIDVMTAWTTFSDDSTFRGKRLAGYITNEPDSAMNLVFGLVTLAGALLTKLEAVTGEEMRTHLQEIVRKNSGP